MKKKRTIIAAVVIILAIAGGVVFFVSKGKADDPRWLTLKVSRGDLNVVVTATGDGGRRYDYTSRHSGFRNDCSIIC